MKIKIIGYDTKAGTKLKDNVIKVVNDLNNNVTINFEEGKKNNKEPVLYIDDILICQGKVISERRLLKYLKKNYKDIFTML